jgi:excisionase family DNA binding protein
MDTGLMTVKGVLQYLKISRPTLYSLINEGKIRTVKIGTRTLFDPEDVKKFIENQKQGMPPMPSDRG